MESLVRTHEEERFFVVSTLPLYLWLSVETVLEGNITFASNKRSRKPCSARGQTLRDLHQEINKKKSLFRKDNSRCALQEEMCKNGPSLGKTISARQLVNVSTKSHALVLHIHTLLYRLKYFSTYGRKETTHSSSNRRLQKRHSVVSELQIKYHSPSFIP